MRDEEKPSGSLDASPTYPSSLIPHPFHVAAILLAAGRSRRMGAFKPLLPFGAQTVIETCVNNLRAAGIEEIVVVVGHRAAQVRSRLAHLPLRFAVNEEVESEMGASIARGVAELTSETDATLIALGDQPAVTPEEIKSVTAAHARTGARLIVPEWRGRGGHPVLIDLSYRDALLHLDASGGLRAFLAQHAGEVLRLSVASPYIARDMDTWEDYRALYEEVFHTPPPFSEPSQAT